MPALSLDHDPHLARAVSAQTLEPRQQPTSLRIKISRDFRQQHMLKHPFRSDFHTLAAHLYAGLLEGDPHVISYIPRPFHLRIGRKHRTPDGYVVADNAPRRVYTITRGGTLDEAERLPLEAFFDQQGLHFELISYESVFDRRSEAENWLEIIRILYRGRDLETGTEETELIERIQRTGDLLLGDLVDPGDRERTYPLEIAIFRLLHRGLLKADLTNQPLDYQTRFTCS